MESTTDSLRNTRDYLLKTTDWTQVGDITLENGDEWVTYRQALRDLPTNTEDPINPVWPEPPQVKIVKGKNTRTELSDTKTELQSEKNKVATMELLVASLVKRVGDLENLVI